MNQYTEKAMKLNQRKLELARKYPTKESLENENRLTLRDLAAGFMSEANKAPKADIIDAIWIATEPERTLIALMPDYGMTDEKPSEDKDKLIQYELVDFSDRLFVDLCRMVERLWSVSEGKWIENSVVAFAGLASKIGFYLSSYRNQQNVPIVPSTALRYRKLILDSVLESIEQDNASLYYKPRLKAFEIIQNTARIQMSDLSRQKKERTDRNLDVRQNSMTLIDFEPVIRWVKAVLFGLDNLKKSQWKDVSVALAIATGRRAAEIHSSASFEIVDEHTVLFTGQLKTKGSAAEYYEQNPSYNIPTLVPAEYVVAGLAWLDENGKRIVPSTPDDSQKCADKAHTRYSKDLSEHLKTLNVLWGIEPWDVGDKKKTLTYHGLRALYAQVCSEVFRKPNEHRIRYLGRILGHGNRADAEYQADKMTQQSYNSDFEVMNAQIV